MGIEQTNLEKARLFEEGGTHDTGGTLLEKKGANKHTWHNI